MPALPDPHQFPELERLCGAAADALKPLMPPGFVFTLLVFAPNAPGGSATAYASTAERTTMMRALREFLGAQARLS